MSVAGNEIGLHSEDTNWNEIDFTFEDIGLNDDLVNGIYANGISKVTPLQFRSLMASKTKHDFLIRSTNVNDMRVSLSMVILRLIEARTEQCQSVILVSSHDVALEMAKYVLSLGEYMSVKCSVCTATTNIAEDLREIRDGVHSIIGTPGRVYDLLAIAAFDTSLVKT
ncbi:eukaryotic initiation factor eIF-4A like protein-like protein, partial [Leptotrombidium deliense]